MSSLFAPCPSGDYNICKLCNAKIKCRTDGSLCDINKHMKRKHDSAMYNAPANTLSFRGVHAPARIPKLVGNTEQSEVSKMYDHILPNTSDQINLKVGDLKLIHPFSLIISGPTSSGKSTLLFQILENLHQNTNPIIEKVVFIYGVYQDVYKNYPNFFFTDNFDYMDLKPAVPTVIILDDVMSTVNNSKKLEELFTRGVHHNKISVVLSLQNLFYRGSVMKTLRDNAMYIILTRHIQDVSKLDTFARQLERKNSNYFKDSYEEAVSRKYGYLMCDLHPHSNLRDGPFKIKYRSLIHQPEGQILYLPKVK